MFLLPSGSHKGHQHGISIQSFIHLGKTLFQIIYLAFEILHRPDFCQGFLYIHFPDSRFSVLYGLYFYFSWRDSVNQEFSFPFLDQPSQGPATWLVKLLLRS